MNKSALIETVEALFSGDKGILAMDESNPTCNKRFAEVGIAQTVEKRRAYREMILTTPKLEECINGLILYDETIRQQTVDGTPFIELILKKGIVPGIKVDLGAKNLAHQAGEKVTEGLDGLRERLQEYYAMGARFAKWRAVIKIGNSMPGSACISVNAHGLARYAALCQEQGLVPIVEPEVLMDGNHTIERCFAVTEELHRAVFNQLYLQGVEPGGTILKSNMILPGLDCAEQSSIENTAQATVNCLLRSAPAAVGGIAFLSGGQPGIDATKRLNEMIKQYGEIIPWPLSFSFARAIQQKALEIWQGKDKNIEPAQQALYHRAWCNVLARRGLYNDSDEHSRT